MGKQPYIVAHRGVSATYPENTLPAFQAAVELAVDWIELDVVTTADGAVIVSHDCTADRCTNGSGAFNEMTLDQAMQLDAGSWFDQQFAGEHIPTLDEVLTLVENTSVKLNVEIKGANPDEFLHTARAVVAQLQRRGAVRQTSIASFDRDCLSAVRQWEPLLTVNLDPTPQNGTLTAWELCQQCLACGANFMGHNYSTLTPAIIEEARAHGLALWAWTVNDVEAMHRMIDLSVDAILTDRPDVLKNLMYAT